MDLKEMKIGQVVKFGNTNPPADDEETMRVERRPNTFYGDCGKYDFEVKTAEEAQAKLTRWGYTVLLQR